MSTLSQFRTPRSTCVRPYTVSGTALGHVPLDPTQASGTERGHVPLCLYQEDSMVVVFGVTFSDKNDWVVAGALRSPDPACLGQIWLGLGQIWLGLGQIWLGRRQIWLGQGQKRRGHRRCAAQPRFALFRPYLAWW
eukprot:660314-Rhodomonas_salina.1